MPLIIYTVPFSKFWSSQRGDCRVRQAMCIQPLRISVQGLCFEVSVLKIKALTIRKEGQLLVDQVVAQVKASLLVLERSCYFRN